MTPTCCLFGTILAAAIGCVAQAGTKDVVVIESGPKEGAQVSVVGIDPYPYSVLQGAENGRITLWTQGRKTNVWAQVSASRMEWRMDLGGTSRALGTFLLEVRAPSVPEFEWSCVTPDFPIPHRLQILTVDSGTNYLCYVRAGVHLFPLTQSRSPELVRQRYWQRPPTDTDHHPDALPVLAMRTLVDNLSWTNTVGMGPQRLDVTVDRLSDTSGELRVTVRGTAAKPECTFALRGGKWELISTSEK